MVESRWNGHGPEGVKRKSKVSLRFRDGNDWYEGGDGRRGEGRYLGGALFCGSWMDCCSKMKSYPQGGE